MDRSTDPSPFGWIFGAMLALVGIASVVIARRPKTEPRSPRATVRRAARRGGEGPKSR